ncbi:EF-hand calcium-binding domain-containing protein 6-like isoform X2 [Anneissia japonica]|nr:EF-hand calcium-binding domain-containing protein 6-like isoform X2 [Anneissia japonica]XP_033107845.1 EF-hand calcium-binding domain-containing protein 6-like isoform X2 [Anneissia japonica]XP_033107847.1 EF-hand calcium-binding domain-containing protein 6-like isoform X2 [Anneissia japonica]
MLDQMFQPTDSVGLSIRPASSGVFFTPREILKTAQSMRRPSNQKSLPDQVSRSWSAGSSSPSTFSVNVNLSSIEVEQLLKDKVIHHYHNLKQAFQNYDIDQSMTITRGELRRVLDTFCFPLTTEQFDSVMAKVPANSNGTINYCDFLDRFAGRSDGSRESWKMTSGHRYSYTQSPHDMGVDVLERQLRERIGANMKNVVRALRLFDYNRDGRIQKHEMRKVLENYCLRMSDGQFDRLWARYDFHHSGIVNYYEFLKRLGINVDRQRKVMPEGAKVGLGFNERQSLRQKDTERLAVINRTDDMVKGMNFKQIEAELRRRMKENYVNLKKAFMAFDSKQDGYITLEDLKSVLIHFTLPMSDQLFSQLMDSCGLKASHKVPWEHFLEKFQHPRIEGNGQTLPIKCNHKVNPIREAEYDVDMKELLKMLHKHVTSRYTSLKDAFLVFDYNHDGKVSRKEFKKILEKFAIHLNRGQVQALMNYLDADCKNSIQYHHFLDLFEVRETEEGHKWLNSAHRYNSEPAPATLAWSTVEDLLKEKIVEYWKPLSTAFRSMDPDKTGCITKRNLRKLLNRHVMALANDHLDSLWNQCEEGSDGKIYLAQFLDVLGVDASPGDVTGTSTHIHVLSDLKEQQRQADLDMRLQQVQMNALNQTNQMSADTVILKLKDRMSQKSSQMRQNFLRYCKNKKGKLYKKEFREVLESFGMYMSDEQFDILCSHIGISKTPLTYTDFIEHFEDLRVDGPGAEIQHTSNHRYTNLPIQTMTAEEVGSKLLKKLREVYGNLRDAFYKLDDDHDGQIGRDDFRRVMDSMMFVISDQEFIALMSRLGISRRTKLNYRQFLDKFEVVDTDEGHKWLDSDHRYNSTLAPAKMAADEVHQILVAKAERQYQDLAKAFRSIDKNSNGVITRKELRDLLYTFMIPMTREEFGLLWKRYDPQDKGYIDHQHFLKMMGRAFAPGDTEGVSKRIVEDSQATLELHHNGQQEKQMNITLNQAQNATFISADELEQKLKDRFRDKYSSFQAAFNAIDTAKTGKVSIKDLQKILLDHNYLVNDDTLKEFLFRIGLTSGSNMLNYSDFLDAFDEARESRYRQKNLPVVRVESFSHLPADKAVKKIKLMVTENAGVLRAAFGAFDREKRGRVDASQFRRILDNFCFKLTNKQFKALMAQVKVHTDCSINYSAFLEEFTTSEQDLAQNWFESLQKQEKKDLSPQQISLMEIQNELREMVAARQELFMERFSGIDYANIGVVTRDDFRNVINELAFRLNDAQFDLLWSTVEVNEFGNMNYRQFIKRYSDLDVSEEIDDVLKPLELGQIPHSASPRRIYSRQTHSSLSSRAGTVTPMVNAENIEHKLKHKIFKYWQKIRTHCRSKDPDDTGFIDVYDFKEIIEDLNLVIPADDFRNLMAKYDIKENGKFSYNYFLRNFVLNMKPTKGNGDRNITSRQRIHRSRHPMTPGTASSDMLDVMLRVGECVVQDWKKMRRIFRGMDPTAEGYITTKQFRDVLRQFMINLSEDEFFHLMTYYDRNLEGRISYNDFLRAYLR